MSAASPRTAVAVPPATPPGVRGPPRRDRGPVLHESLEAVRWTTAGLVRVDHDARVGRAKLRGTTVVGGTLAALELASDGRLEVRGALEVTGQLRLTGTLEAGSSVRAGELVLDGRVRVAGELAAERTAEVRGALQAAGVRGAPVDLRGVAVVPGEVLGPVVRGTFAGDSAIGAVRGHTVELRGPLSDPLRWALGRSANVRIERVEAQRAVLVGVRVGFARAPEIVLGREAHLGAYEGRVVAAHPSSRVGPESWSPPPTGLRR